MQSWHNAVSRGLAKSLADAQHLPGNTLADITPGLLTATNELHSLSNKAEQYKLLITSKKSEERAASDKQAAIDAANRKAEQEANRMAAERNKKASDERNKKIQEEYEAAKKKQAEEQKAAEDKAKQEAQAKIDADKKAGKEMYTSDELYDQSKWGIQIPEYKTPDGVISKARDSVFDIEDESPEHKAKREAKEAAAAEKRKKKEEEQKAKDAAKANDKQSDVKKNLDTFNQMMLEQYDTARKMVDKTLDDKMNAEIDEIKKKFNISDEAAEKIRQTIRSHKQARLNQAALVVLAQEETATQVNKFVKDQVNSFYKENTTGKSIWAIHKADADVTKFYEDMQKFATAKDNTDLAASITHQLDAALGYKDPIMGVSERLDAGLAKIGLSGVKTGPMFEALLKDFDTKGTGSKIANKLQPFIKKQLDVIKSVTKVIQEIDATIKKFEAKVQEMIQAAQAKITAYLQEQEAKLISDISSKIHIQF